MQALDQIFEISSGVTGDRPVTTGFGTRRRQLFCAASSSLKTIASAVLLDGHPFDRMVRWRTVAKVLSMGLVVRRCF